MAPESMDLVKRSATESPYQLDETQIFKASSALLKHIQDSALEKTKSVAKKSLLGSDPSSIANAEPIWLVLSTKKHIVPQPRLKPGKILLPHSLNVSPSLSICLITPDPQRPFKNLVAHPSFPPDLSKRISRVIDIKKLAKKYQSFESRRQLRDSYDIFLADDRIVTYLSKILGKSFYNSATKRPIPIHLAAYKQNIDKKNAALPSTKPKKDSPDSKSITAPHAAAKEIDRTLSTTQVYLSPSVTTSIRVGLSSHSPDQLAENIKAVVEGMAEKYLPRQWRGIQAIHIKGPNTMALPVWLANELWENDNMVLEDQEAEELRMRVLENGKKKKRRVFESKGQLAIDNGGVDPGRNKPDEETKKRKRDVEGEDFSHEMKQTREKLKEQKEKIRRAIR